MAEMDDVIYFHTDAEPNYFLSNFYPHAFRTKTKFDKIEIEYQGLIYPTSEHLYQALKFRCETRNEKRWREIIRKSNTPTIAKYLGHQFTYTQYEWQKKLAATVTEYREKVRYVGDPNDLSFRISIMKVAILAKFRVSPLKELLLETYPKKIEEQSDDLIWGSGGGKGLSLLGKVLMGIRDHLLIKKYSLEKISFDISDHHSWVLYPHLMTSDRKGIDPRVTYISSDTENLDDILDIALTDKKIISLYPRNEKSMQVATRLLQRYLIFEGTDAEEYMSSVICD